MMNLKFFIGVGCAEVIFIIAFAGIVYGILNMDSESIKQKDNPKLVKIRKALIFSEHLILWVITGLLIVWLISQFVVGDAVISISSKNDIVSILVAIVLAFFVINIPYAVTIVLLQISIVIFAYSLGNIDYSINKELVNTQKITYVGRETESKINSGKWNGSTFVDFYYCIEDDIEKCYTTEYYDIILVRDLKKGKQEYYTLYNQTKHNRYKGLGCYYDEEIKPRIEIHTYMKQ